MNGVMEGLRNQQIERPMVRRRTGTEVKQGLQVFQKGRLLPSDIMRGGTFDHSNVLLHHSKGDGTLKRTMRRFRRDFSFLRYYPIDIISNPFWKLWHWCLKKKKGYI